MASRKRMTYVGDSPYTVEDYEALTDLQDAEDDAADALKAAYDARVAATNDVEENQRDTQQYLDQLVLLRQGQKACGRRGCRCGCRRGRA